MQNRQPGILAARELDRSGMSRTPARKSSRSSSFSRFEPQCVPCQKNRYRLMDVEFEKGRPRLNREIVLDTETTGLDPEEGHRIVEIGCVELSNHVPTGRTYHQFVNPERDIPEDAQRIHKLGEAFLSGQPRFPEICDQLIEFVGDSRLIMHNAPFDMGFLNAELVAAGARPIAGDRAVDTLEMARAVPGRFELPGCSLPAVRNRQFHESGCTRRIDRRRAPRGSLPGTCRRPSAGPGACLRCGSCADSGNGGAGAGGSPETAGKAAGVTVKGRNGSSQGIRRQHGRRYRLEKTIRISCPCRQIGLDGTRISLNSAPAAACTGAGNRCFRY